MCTKCLESKEAGQFNRDKTKADGLQFRCKTCVHDYMRKRRRTEASQKAEELEARRLEVATDNLAVLAQVDAATGGEIVLRLLTDAPVVIIVSGFIDADP